MTQKERFEISMLPEKYRPMGAWGYVGYTILFNIPLVGLICLIVFALSDAKVARRSYARSYFCWLLLAVIIGLIATALVLFVPAIAEPLVSFIQSLVPSLGA